MERPVLKLTLLAGALALSLCGADAAQAASLKLFGYDISASFTAGMGPTFPGSKHYGFFPSGNVATTTPGAFDAFFAPDDNASFALYHNARVALGVTGSLIHDRGNSHELQGMRNIGWAVQSGGFLNVWPTDWLRLHAEVMKGLVSEHGLVLNTGADLVHRADRLTLSGGPRFSWADDSYNGTYFGVTPAEAAASPFIDAPYTAKAGPLSAGVAVAAEYKLYPQWKVVLTARYRRLLSQDAASPIVGQIGTPNQVTVGAGFRWLMGN
jgi:outer membrane protein